MPIPHLLETILDRPIAYQRCFFDLTRSIKAALLLSQAVYWSKRTKDEGGWFYKSRDEWQAEIGMSREEQEGARRILRQLGFWQEKLQGVPGRLFYRIDFDTLAQKLASLNQEQGGKPANKLAENPPTRKRKTTRQAGGKSPDKLAEKSPTFITEITSETTSETSSSSSANTRKPKPKAAAASQFTKLEILTFLAATKPGNETRNQGLAHKLWQTGEDDYLVAMWLAEKKEIAARRELQELQRAKEAVQNALVIADEILEKFNASDREWIPGLIETLSLHPDYHEVVTQLRNLL